MAQERRESRRRFVIRRGLLGFGLPLYVIIFLAQLLRGHGQLTAHHLVTKAAECVVGGVFFGLFLWTVRATRLGKEETPGPGPG